MAATVSSPAVPTPSRDKLTCPEPRRGASRILGSVGLVCPFGRQQTCPTLGLYDQGGAFLCYNEDEIFNVMTRFLKQFAYGIFYLAVLAFVLFLVYSAIFKTAPAASDEILNQDSPIPEIPQPTFVFEELKTEVEGEKVKVTGILKNESPQIAPRVIIRAVLFDEEGVELFTSETLREDIRAFETRPFIVFFPEDRGLAEEVEVESTMVSYEVR
jgi:hypothetical protein